MAVFEDYLGFHGQVIALALAIMVAGMLVTCARRTVRIASDLKKR